MDKRIKICYLIAFSLLCGCSNDSGTSGPQTMPVELSVTAQGVFHGVPGATVIVDNLRPGGPPPNLRAVTDTGGVAVFATDINVLIPNHAYKIIVPDFGGWTKAFPEADTIRIPSAPNQPWGYDLEATVQMKPQGS